MSIAIAPGFCPQCHAPLVCRAITILPGSWQWECGSIGGAHNLTTGLCERRQIEALQARLNERNRTQDRKG